MMMISGLIIAFAIEESNLHKRIALRLLLLMGTGRNQGEELDFFFFFSFFLIHFIHCIIMIQCDLVNVCVMTHNDTYDQKKKKRTHTCTHSTTI